MQDEAPAAAPRKVTILEMRIRIFAPLDPRDPFLAKIGNAPILIEAPSATAAKRKAEEWRQAEWAKHHPKEQRA